MIHMNEDDEVQVRTDDLTNVTDELAHPDFQEYLPQPVKRFIENYINNFSQQVDNFHFNYGGDYAEEVKNIKKLMGAIITHPVSKDILNMIHNHFQLIIKYKYEKKQSAIDIKHIIEIYEEARSSEKAEAKSETQS